MITKRRLRKVKGTLRSCLQDPKLLASLARILRHPTSSNFDRREPWWSAGAIAYLAAELPTEAKAFEWGSGGSTVWLEARGAQVTSVESEEIWAGLVREAAPSAEVRWIPGQEDGQLRSEPKLRDRGRHYFDDYVAAIDAYPDGHFDLVVVDGLCRAACARRAAAKVKPGGLVVLDDIQRPYLQNCLLPFEGWSRRSFRGFKRPDRLPSGRLTWSNEVAQTTFLKRPEA